MGAPPSSQRANAAVVCKHLGLRSRRGQDASSDHICGTPTNVIRMYSIEVNTASSLTTRDAVPAPATTWKVSDQLCQAVPVQEKIELVPSAICRDLTEI
jgi:hypothetical protein